MMILLQLWYIILGIGIICIGIICIGIIGNNKCNNRCNNRCNDRCNNNLTYIIIERNLS